MAKKKSKKPLWVGIVHIAMFKIQCPLFLSEEDRLKTLKARGMSSDSWPTVAVGQVNRDKNAEGAIIYTMVITPGCGVDTWAHEAVHLADFVMDDLALPTGVENTEVRAYMVGHIVEQIDLIMEEVWDKMEGSVEPPENRRLH